MTDQKNYGPEHTFFALAPGCMPTRAQFDEAWDGTEHLLVDGEVILLGGRRAGREGAWTELVRLHADFRHEGAGAPGGPSAYEHLLASLGIDREELQAYPGIAAIPATPP